MNGHVYIGFLLWLIVLFPVNLTAGADEKQQASLGKKADVLNKLAEDTLEADHNISLELGLQALEEAGENPAQKARAHCNIGEAHYKAERFKQSTLHFIKANKLYQELANHEKTGYTYLSIGINHYYTGKYTASIRAYKNAELLYKETGQKDKLALVYQNIGLVHNELDQEDKALEYLHRSQNIFIERTKTI